MHLNDVVLAFNWKNKFIVDKIKTNIEFTTSDICGELIQRQWLSYYYINMNVLRMYCVAAHNCKS